MPHNVGYTSPMVHLLPLLTADEWFLCLSKYPTALDGSDLLLTSDPFSKPLPPLVPWLAVLLLYITLPKCNLLKHALTQLLIVELKSKIKPCLIDLSFSDVHPDCTPCPVF